jgi:signal transduction histidine kinase
MDTDRQLVVAGLAVWAGVGLVVGSALDPWLGLAWLAWAAAFLVGVSPARRDRVRSAAVAVQTLVSLGLHAAGLDVAAALLCVTAGQLPFLTSARTTALLVVAQTAVLGAVEFGREGAADAALTALVYGSFQLFAAGTAGLVMRERGAREVVLRMNQELLAARAELAVAERRGERLRIARDLHDAVGHHLTALTLQLELAARTVTGPEAETVRTARDQVRSLLTEVRATVTVLRDEPVALSVGLRALAALPRPVVTVEGAPAVEGPVAEALLRCAQEVVTNAARHGRASHVWLTFTPEGGGLSLHARDDGPGGDAAEGNGLRALRERVASAGGTLELGAGPGFPLRVWVPT